VKSLLLKFHSVFLTCDYTYHCNKKALCLTRCRQSTTRPVRGVAFLDLLSSCIFRELYLSMSVGADSTTTIENVVSLVSCVELYLQEVGSALAQLRVMLNGSASYGRLDILAWAHERGYSHACSEEMSNCAVKHGQLAALIWLKDRGSPLSCTACNDATSHRHLNFLQWLRANGCSWDEETCYRAAAEGGHLNILQWARGAWMPLGYDHVSLCT